MAINKAFRGSTIVKEVKSSLFWRDVIAEFLGTFMLMSVQSALPLTFGDPSTGGPVKIALGVGFIVATMAWSLGDFGGGHINPAVSVAMVTSGDITILRGVLYIISQSVGAIAGCGFIYAVTPADHRGNLAATGLGPGVASWQGFLVEAWVTCILVLTIYGATNSDRKGNVYMPTIIIGFAVTLGIISAFNHTGGSLNPARSFGPAVILSLWDNHWVYWFGPIVGGIIASLLYKYFLNRIDQIGTQNPSRHEYDNEAADQSDDNLKQTAKF